MRVQYDPKADSASLLDPGSKIWSGRRREVLDLMGAPAGMQPTGAIRAAYADKKIGAVSSVSVSALHDGEVIAFRLEWKDPSDDASIDDNDTFPDAAALAFPVHEDAPMVLMGAPGMPVNAWYWRADEADQGRHVTAEGLGTSRLLDRSLVKAKGQWQGGRRALVISRSMQIGDVPGAAQFAPGGQSRFGVAIWDGSQGERAGIKAFSVKWRELTIDALPGKEGN
jgi:DMSO reductase family type II enzyme heme b subunit